MSTIGPQAPLLPGGESPKNVERKTSSPTSITARAADAASAAWKKMSGGDKKTSEGVTSRYNAMQNETAPPEAKKTESVVTGKIGEMPTARHSALEKPKTADKTSQERPTDEAKTKPWRPDRSKYGTVEAPGIRESLLDNEAPSVERTRRLQNEQVQGYVDKTHEPKRKG